MEWIASLPGNNRIMHSTLLCFSSIPLQQVCDATIARKCINYLSVISSFMPFPEIPTAVSISPETLIPSWHDRLPTTTCRENSGSPAISSYHFLSGCRWPNQCRSWIGTPKPTRNCAFKYLHAIQNVVSSRNKMIAEGSQTVVEAIEVVAFRSSSTLSPVYQAMRWECCSYHLLCLESFSGPETSTSTRWMAVVQITVSKSSPEENGSPLAPQKRGQPHLPLPCLRSCVSPPCERPKDSPARRPAVSLLFIEQQAVDQNSGNKSETVSRWFIHSLTW